MNSVRRTVIEFLVKEKDFDWDQTDVEKQVNDGRYEEDLPVENYFRGFDLLRKLVSGQISFKPNSPITYWDN